MTMIQAKIADVDDLQARRISVTENLLRQDLSAIETIEATIEIIDMEMGEDPWFLTVGKTPLERVYKLLSKLDSIRRSKERGSVVLEADKVFQEVTQKGSLPLKDQNNHLLAKLELNEFSAREIQTFAEDIEKTNIKKQQKIDTAQHEFSTQIKIAVMTRLGMPLVRIAQRLNIHRETISKYTKKKQELFNKIHQEFKSGTPIPDMAQKYSAPQSLVWSVILEEKTNQERFKHLNWGLRAWDNWYFNDVDHRFGDPWPGRIPAVDENPDNAILMFPMQNC